MQQRGGGGEREKDVDTDLVVYGVAAPPCNAVLLGLFPCEVPIFLHVILPFLIFFSESASRKKHREGKREGG